ncbi:tetratricopeptide repeat protein [uncultured Microscilla sp.]|uniref:tetratricopeptide repeat protein n=1 Tax=uncultured Microscilla sp. TaxID=432653 RepID=UPI00260D0D72|nr:tetratricopeptide repeat protein [uncultured Microscilla sp.]
MLRSQVVIITLASVLIFGMYLLPKAIVKGKKQVTQPSKSKQADTPKNMGEETHNQPSLSKQQLTQLANWKNAISSSTNKEKKIIFADSIANLFKSANQFDSVAFYKAKISEWKPSINSWMQAGNAYLFAARFALNQAKVEKSVQNARGYFNQVLKQKEDFLDAKAQMAQTYLMVPNKQNPMQGVQMLLQVIKKDPNNQLALFILGERSMQVRKYDKAIERFEKLLSLNPKNENAQYYLGMAYVETGKKLKALEIFKNIEKVSTDSAKVAGARSYLQQLK